MAENISKKTVFEFHKPTDYVKDYIASHKTISKDTSISSGLTCKIKMKQNKNQYNAGLNLDPFKTFTSDDSRNFNTFNTTR